MSYRKDVEAAKQKMLQAEAALDEYLKGPTHDPLREKALAEAEKVATTEYIDLLAKL